MNVIAIDCPICATTAELAAPAVFIDVDSRETGTAVAWFVCSTCTELVGLGLDWMQLIALTSVGGHLVEAPQV